MSLIDQVLARVAHPRKDGEWFTALCPVHEMTGNGHHASLRLRAATQVPEGVIVTCMAGCAREDMQAALGLSGCQAKTSASDDHSYLFWVREEKPGRRIVATYDYTDEAGQLLFQKARYEPKTFVQRRPLEGHWAWGLSAGEYAQDELGDWRRAADDTSAAAPRRTLPQARQVLYHLPELLTAETVVVAEGEKAADALRSLGLSATCASGGAGKWRADYAACLTGRRVIVCPDNDEQGRKHGEIVIAALRKAGVTCCTVRLPGLPDKGDPYDAVQAGLTADQLAELAAAAFARRETVETAEVYAAKRAEYRLTEGGNAERFAAQHVGKVAFVPERGFLAYRDGVFTKDDTTMMRCAKETIMAMYADAGRIDEADGRRALSEHARRSDTQRAMNAMVSLAAHEPSLEVPIAEFDADPYRLCVKNGVVDLKTGDLLPHGPELRMLKRAGASYSLDAKCPTWMAHLNRIFAGDSDLVMFLQVLFGYALTGLSIEQVFAIFHGGGANGKSVTLHLMDQAMADYACSADASTFSRHKSDAIRNDLARLNGARLVTTFERGTRQTLDEETIKRLTGGDKITARFLHQEAFEYTPQFLIVMSTNAKPTVDSADYAIKRRVLLVPFGVTIPDDEQDKFLEQKLQAELDGILTWGVLGATMYCDGGLTVPESVSAATQQYRNEMDPLQGFAEYLCPDPTAWISAAEVRSALERWAKEDGVRNLPAGRAFAAWMVDHGATPDRKRTGRGWRGVSVEGCHAEHSMDLQDGSW